MITAWVWILDQSDMIDETILCNRQLRPFQRTDQGTQPNAKGVLHNAGSHSSFAQKTKSPCRPCIGWPLL